MTPATEPVSEKWAGRESGGQGAELDGVDQVSPDGIDHDVLADLQGPGHGAASVGGVDTDEDPQLGVLPGGEGHHRPR